jgi:hypothetical protein
MLKIAPAFSAFSPSMDIKIAPAFSTHMDVGSVRWRRERQRAGVQAILAIPKIAPAFSTHMDVGSVRWRRERQRGGIQSIHGHQKRPRREAGVRVVQWNNRITARSCPSG